MTTTVGQEDDQMSFAEIVVRAAIARKTGYTCDPAWRRLGDIREHKRIIQLNKSHLLLASSSQTGGIYKWSILNDQYSKFLDYPQNLSLTKGDDFNVVRDDETGKLYFIIANIIHVLEQGIWYSFQSRSFDVASLAMVNANGLLHLVGGANSRSHYVWKDERKQFEQKSQFVEYSNIDGVSLIYVKSKDVIFMIGGSGKECVGIWNHIKPVGIMIWKANVWSSLDLDFHYSYAATTLTQNEEYIIISGGSDLGRYNNSIYVLDIRDDKYYRLKKLNSLRVPKLRTVHNVFSLRGGIKEKLLIMGFVKNLFGSSKFEGVSFPPNDVLQMVYDWYCVEEIHWIETGETNENDHFSVELSHIVELYEQETENVTTGNDWIYENDEMGDYLAFLASGCYFDDDDDDDDTNMIDRQD